MKTAAARNSNEQEKRSPRKKNCTRLQIHSIFRQDRLQNKFAFHIKIFSCRSVPGSARKMTTQLPTLLGTGTALVLASLLKNVAQQPCSQPLHNIELRSVRSVWVFEDLISEAKHQNRYNQFIIEPPTYSKWLHRIFGTVKFVAGKTLKKSFVCQSTTSQMPKRSSVEKVLHLSRMVTPDSSGAYNFAFV